MWLPMLLAASLLAPAEGVQFHDGSLEDALKEAAKTNKLVFIDFYTDW